MSTMTTSTSVLSSPEKPPASRWTRDSLLGRTFVLLSLCSCAVRPREVEAPPREQLAEAPRAGQTDEHDPPGSEPRDNTAAAPAKEAAKKPPPGPSASTADAAVEAKLVFVRDTCAMLCEDTDNCSCELAQDLGDAVVLRMLSNSGRPAFRWFIGRLADDKFELLAPADVNLPPYSEDPPRDTYMLCMERSTTVELPEGAGLTRLETVDLTRDGKRDILLECNAEFVDSRYLRVCEGGYGRCTEELWLRRVEGKILYMESEIEFIDGWVVQHVTHANEWAQNQTSPLYGVRTPRPAAAQ